VSSQRDDSSVGPFVQFWSIAVTALTSSAEWEVNDKFLHTDFGRARLVSNIKNLPDDRDNATKGFDMAQTVRHAHIRRITAVLLGTLLTIAVAPSVASAACASRIESNPFALFGDGSSYTLAPDGSFESPTVGWSLNGARVVSGNETFNAVRGSHSLAIDAGGNAISPAICIGYEYPTFRFFAHRLSGSTGSLEASLRWISILGVSVNTSAGSTQGTTAWAPSPVMKLGNSLPLWLPGSTLDVQIVFHASGPGSWAIDDVYVDPYRR
jgi:hypothetical protein